jgi:hypothetical protein
MAYSYIGEGFQIFPNSKNYVSAAAAVSAVRPASRDVLLAPEGYGSLAAVS